MGSFATRCGGHVKHALVGLWGQGNNRKKRRSGLEHVMSSKILGSSTSIMAKLVYGSSEEVGAYLLVHYSRKPVVQHWSIYRWALN